MQLQPRNTPCGSCPYRTDCPSGVWHKAEYAKLIEYDRDTAEQPVGTFMCHDAADGKTMCRGWLDTHDKYHLLSLRMAVSNGMLNKDIFALPQSACAVFASGKEAAKHGMKDYRRPGKLARKVVGKLTRRSAE